MVTDQNHVRVNEEEGCAQKSLEKKLVENQLKYRVNGVRTKEMCRMWLRRRETRSLILSPSSSVFARCGAAHTDSRKEVS